MNTFRLFIYFFLFLFGFLIGDLHSQPEQIKFKHVTLADGLSNPEIWAIYKDRQGFLWFGTAFGLNRFDGISIKKFVHDPKDSTSILGDGILKIFETPEGQLGIRTLSGISIYDSKTETFDHRLDSFFKQYHTLASLQNIVHARDDSFWFVELNQLVRYKLHEPLLVAQHHPEDRSSILPTKITDFQLDASGTPWVVHENGVAEKISIENQKITVTERLTIATQEATYSLLPDAKGNLWFYVSGSDETVVFRKDKISGQYPARPAAIKISALTALIEDPDGNLWASSDHGGIYILNPAGNIIRHVQQREGDITSLAANSISQMFKDNQGIIWVGSSKRGVSYYHPDILPFDIYKHYALDDHTLPFADVNCFEEDNKGNLWIGANGGGLIYLDRKTGKFQQYLHQPDRQNSLSSNVVVSLEYDTDGNLWIGTFRGGLNKFDGKQFIRYEHIPGDTTSLPNNHVWTICEDSQKRLWIGTLEGAAEFDKKKEKFRRLKNSGANALQTSVIYVIKEDHHQNLWFGTVTGVDVLAPDRKTFTHYGAGNHAHALSENIVQDIFTDSQDRTWVATNDGLNRFDPTIGGFHTYRENNERGPILSLQEDASGNLWVSSMKGLSKLLPIAPNNPTAVFRHYTELDGLQGRQFNARASLKTKDGKIIFGGPEGFNIIHGNQIKTDFVVDKIVFTDVYIDGKPVGIQESIDDVVVLKNALPLTEQITFPASTKSFTLKFSGLNYFSPARDQYHYKIDQRDTNWMPLGESNQITFNALRPGTYTLRIKAINRDQVSGKGEAVLSIVILPPLWKSKQALVAYALLLLALLLLARRWTQARERLKYELALERRETQRFHELDMLKTKFFTNVSHEFRTPLSLILTPLESLIDKTQNQEQLTQLTLIQRNGKRLLNLVNQLLDFKKLEVDDIKYNPAFGDIIQFTQDIVASFSDIAEKKNISLTFVAHVDRLETLFDHDKLEKILFNLLSNAFKFTLDKGQVTVDVSLDQENGGSSYIIQVSDTGIGIPADKLDRIFDPFFQSDTTQEISNSGSGIGLAITKDFVHIHGGRITVTSSLGTGSCFNVTLPVTPVKDNTGSTASTESKVAETSSSFNPSDKYIQGIQHMDAKDHKVVLLIDDNDDFRFYIKDNLRFSYIIHEANNGMRGWEQVLTLKPDLVVTDIMMPGMSGLELCAKIKSDKRFAHIPVILLTAINDSDQRIKGLNLGAADYFTKPFNFEILAARISNLLQQQTKKTINIKASEIQVTSLDVKFVERAVKAVETHIASPEFTVDELALELGISRAYVFKKIQALTGKTPLEFIRTIRLQQAAQLLEKSQLTVQEVAYKVGFNSPKYFSKYFKEEYGVLPSVYAGKDKKQPE